MKRFDRLRPEAGRVVKFTLVGLSNTAIALAVYALLLALGIDYLLAGALAWTLGLINGYTWNRLWTFDRAQHRTSLLVRYFAVGALGIAMNTGLLAVLVSGADLAELPAEILALPIVVLTTFLINRVWVFRSHMQDRSAQP